RPVEEFHQHQDDELHGRVVVVVEDDLVALDLLQLGLALGGEIALVVFSLVGVAGHREAHYSNEAPPLPVPPSPPPQSSGASVASAALCVAISRAAATPPS